MPGLNFKGTNKYQKIAETMLKKTHFTESEIDRLSDLHNDIIVCKIDITRLKSRFRSISA